LGFEVRIVSVAPPVHVALVRRSVATLTSGDRDRTPSPAGLESDLTWSCPAPRSIALAFSGDCGIWDHACVQVAGLEVDTRRSNTGASGQRSGPRVCRISRSRSGGEWAKGGQVSVKGVWESTESVLVQRSVVVRGTVGVSSRG